MTGNPSEPTVPRLVLLGETTAAYCTDDVCIVPTAAPLGLAELPDHRDPDDQECS
jgi:hypothetical protein